MTLDGKADGKDFKAHASTYNGFIGLVKWGTVAGIASVALVVALLVG